MNIYPSTLDWLLAGDPAIRWQVQRDLLDEPITVYGADRQRVATEGWGAQLLARQDPDGKWAGGVYSPKWISTTYTLLLLRQMGLPFENPQARRACEHFWSRGLYQDGGINLFRSIDYSETCVNGMLLALLCYFRHPDERIHSVADYLLGQQMEDGGWNCERIKGATHGSFHTTISVLEGLAEYRHAFPQRAIRIRPAERRAQEFLLLHRLYFSHRSGKVADPAMTRMYFPPRWRYDFIRALNYFQSSQARPDERMSDAIELLMKKQTLDGRWLAYRPWAGRTFFELEATGQPSRWNTLRALRVLKWWEKE
jgi:hypothetical protein